MYDNLFGRNLRALRNFNRLSQKQFASMLGCNRVRVSRLESGLVSPTVDEIYMIMELFGVSADSLFCLSN